MAEKLSYLYQDVLNRLVEDETRKFNLFQSCVQKFIPAINARLENSWGQSIIWLIEFKKAEIEIWAELPDPKSTPETYYCSRAWARIHIRQQKGWPVPRFTAQFFIGNENKSQNYPFWLSKGPGETSLNWDEFYALLAEQDLAYVSKT